MSSLSRAFTTRRAKASADGTPAAPKRSLTTKFSGGNIRNKISAPLELISTTNMLSYNAPDLFPKSKESSDSSSHSGDESDRSPSTFSNMDKDTSSIESSSPTTSSPEPNHLSCYFRESEKVVPDVEAPIVPKRAVSHTKKASLQRSASRLSTRNTHSTARSSINMFSPQSETVEQHPFGNELAQVSELAEEFGIKKSMAVVDEEEQELASRGLLKFRAEDYLSEIHGLFLSTFAETRPTLPASMWI